MSIRSALKKFIGLSVFDADFFHIMPQFDFAFKFSQGFCPVEINKKYGYIDYNGNLVISPIFDSGNIFGEDGLASVGYKLNGKHNFGYINKLGELVISPKFDFAHNFKNGFARVKINEIYYNIDAFGNYVPDDELPLNSYHSFSEGLAKVYSTDQQSYGFIDEVGRTVLILDQKIESVENFNGGVARARINGKYGFINKSGDFIIDPIFAYARDFHSGIARVGKSDTGKFGYINISGEYVVECKYRGADDFSDGWADVLHRDKWGFINTRGDFIIPPSFEYTVSASEGYVAVKYDGKFGFIQQSNFTKL